MAETPKFVHSETFHNFELGLLIGAGWHYWYLDTSWDWEQDTTDGEIVSAVDISQAENTKYTLSPRPECDRNTLICE